MNLLLALFLVLPLGDSPPADSSGSQVRLSRGDFARGIELRPESDDAVQTLLLPESVYLTLSDNSLSDLRVFNAAGEEVPHALRSLVDAKRIEHADVERPLFALRGENGEDRILGDLSLQIKRNAEGRVLELVTRDTTAVLGERPAAPILAYLVDLGSLGRPADALRFQLPRTPISFLASYTVEASADLANWSTLVQRATLASLDREGMRLEHTRVLLPSTSMPYLRLRWLDDAPKVTLRSVKLELSSESGVPTRRRLLLAGRALASDPGTYLFPSPGPLPINRIQLELPEQNTLIQAAVKTRLSVEDPWYTVLSARFFRITNGVELRNDALPIPTHTSRHWALFVDPQGGGLGAGSPQLELEYFPHQLAFVARGAGPFTLAYGKAQADHAEFSWSSVTQLLSAEQRASLPKQSVKIGPSFELAGDSALIAPVEDRRMKQAALWLILILGMAMLGGFSWKLLRKMPTVVS